RAFHVTGVQTCALPISCWRPLRSGFRWPVRSGEETPLFGMVAGRVMPPRGRGPLAPGDQPPPPLRRQDDGMGDARGVFPGSLDPVDRGEKGMTGSPFLLLVLLMEQPVDLLQNRHERHGFVIDSGQVPLPVDQNGSGDGGDPVGVVSFSAIVLQYRKGVTRLFQKGGNPGGV